MQIILTIRVRQRFFQRKQLSAGVEVPAIFPAETVSSSNNCLIYANRFDSIFKKQTQFRTQIMLLSMKEA
jgi:hypothetical protein